MDLAKNPQIKSVSELMETLEGEIAALKDGTLKESTGRLVMQGRRMQFRAVELVLQAARLNAGLREELIRRIGTMNEGRKAITEDTSDKAV